MLSKSVCPSTSKFTLIVCEPVTASVEPLNVRLPLSSISPDVPAKTTLPDVRSDTFAVSATSVSIFAVPSIYKSFHSKPEAPKSLALSELGTRSLSKRPVAVIVSLVAFPRSTLPLITPLPVTVRFPATVAFSSTVSVSIFAVPSMNKSCHSKSDCPKSLAPSVLGVKSLSKRPVAVIVSLVAFPKSVSPVTTILVVVRIDPSKVRLPLSSSSPDEPAITTLLSVRSPIFAVSASNASMFAVPSTKRLFHSFVAEPKLYVPSSSGIICESTSPPKTILSVFASPKVSVPPLKVVVPVTSRLLYIKTSEAKVDTPTCEERPATTC